MTASHIYEQLGNGSVLKLVSQVGSQRARDRFSARVWMRVLRGNGVTGEECRRLITDAAQRDLSLREFAARRSGL
jgi:hypothetical protein